MSEPRTAEGSLLQKYLQASGQSAREAARTIGISDTRLRHIINGYQPAGSGQRLEVTAPAATLARIAQHLGVHADELEEAGRSDAATILRTSPLQRSDQADPRLSEASLDELLDELAARRSVRPTEVPTLRAVAHDEETSIEDEQGHDEHP